MVISCHYKFRMISDFVLVSYLVFLPGRASRVPADRATKCEPFVILVYHKPNSPTISSPPVGLDLQDILVFLQVCLAHPDACRFGYHVPARLT
jgi:hypothetical protein